MDDLLSEFLTGTTEIMESLDVEAVRLEREPNDPELLGGIFRLAHMIKGTCGLLGLTRLEGSPATLDGRWRRFSGGVYRLSQDLLLVLNAAGLPDCGSKTAA